MVNVLLVLLDLSSDINQLFLVHLDEFQVLPCDIIVVFLHFSEGFLVVLHEVVDMLVLPLFNLMDFDFESEFKFSS